MKWLLVVFLPLILALPLTTGARAQSGGGHTLYGDFKVDDSKADKLAPITFHILLYSESGFVLARQPIANNGRFRFMDVSNGQYDLVVEVENNEVARVPVRLNEPRKTDIQRDIYLEWQATSGSRRAGTPSVIEFYGRTEENQKLFNQSQEAIRKGENDQAIALLQQVVKADPKDYVAWADLGAAYFKEGNGGEAEKAYQRALEQKPTFFPAQLNLGKVRFTKKDFEAAIETLTQAVKERPQSADANYWLGESYLQIKKGSKAVGYLNEAIRLDPAGKAEAHLRLALLYHGAGLKERAVAEYKQFLAKKPDYPEKKKLQQYISEYKKP